MKKLLLLLIIPFMLFFGCEKEKSNSEEEVSSTITHTIFVGNFYYDPPNNVSFGGGVFSFGEKPKKVVDLLI